MLRYIYIYRSYLVSKEGPAITAEPASAGGLVQHSQILLIRIVFHLYMLASIWVSYVDLLPLLLQT